MTITELTKTEYRTYEMPEYLRDALSYSMKMGITSTAYQWYWLLPFKSRDQILFKTKKRKSKKQLAGSSTTYLLFDETTRPVTIEKL